MSRAITSVLQDLSRLYDLLQSSDGLTVPEMSVRLGIPEATLYRHLEYLRAFWGEESLECRDARYALSREAPRMVRVGMAEKRMLAIAHKLLDQVGVPNAAEIARLFIELSGGDTERASQERAAMRSEADRHLAFSEPVLCRPPEDQAVISQLYACCIERPQRRVRFRYVSASRPEPTERSVIPLGLIFYNAWYLVGYDPRREPVERVYAIDRMSSLRPDPFSSHQEVLEFDIQVFMAAAWRLIVGDRQPRKVVLRMPKRFAGFHKHQTQVVESDEGEHVCLAFYVAEPEEMIPFILGHGDEAEVLEPLSLREAVASRALATLNRYRR